MSGSITTQINAADNVGVTGLTVSVDGASLGRLTSAPWTVNWNTTGAADGAHTLTATACDAAGNTSQATVSVTVNNHPDTTPPSITILSPANGTTASRTVSVTVNASDNVRVTKVALYVDNQLTATSSTAPFATSWNPKKASTGAHQLQCYAYDAAGNVGYSQVVTVNK